MENSELKEVALSLSYDATPHPNERRHGVPKWLTNSLIARQINVLLVIAIYAITSISAMAYQFEYNGLYYNITSSNNKTCEVTFGPSGKIDNGSFVGSSDYAMSEVTIPEGVSYNGTRYLVTSIGKYAFYKCSSITSLTVGGNVTTIDERAFGFCSNLKNVTLSESVKILKDYSFLECRGITTIKMPGVEYIGKQALAYLTSLSTLNIPSSLKLINGEALACMRSLQSIKVDNGNQYFTSDNGILYNKEKSVLVHFPENSTISEFEVPNGVVELDTLCFFWSKLQRIKLPETVRTIRSRAFGSCTELKEIDLGHSVENMGEYGTFIYCPKLKSITIPNKVKALGADCFSLVPELEEIIVGENVSLINSSFFSSSGNSSEGIPDNSVFNNLILLCTKAPSGIELLPRKPIVRHGLIDNLKASSSGWSYQPSYFEYIYAYTQPIKGQWYESSEDYTGLYCKGDTLFAFSRSTLSNAPSDMSNYASESDYKYNPTAKFYYNSCQAFDMRMCGIKVSDLVGRKISADAIIGKTADNIEECGIKCYTLYTSVVPEYTRLGDEYHMNTYRVINFAAPQDDGNGYPYYLVTPVIGERCKVKGTYYSTKGGLFASGKNYSYTLKLWGAEGLTNGQTYELEGIVRKINGQYIFDISDNIILENSIAKQPIYGDMKVELNISDTNASYQWFQVKDSKYTDPIEFSASRNWNYTGQGEWKSSDFSKESGTWYLESLNHYEEGDTLYINAEVIYASSYNKPTFTIKIGGENLQLSNNECIHVIEKEQDSYLYFGLKSESNNSSYAIIHKVEVRRVNPKGIGFIIDGVTSNNLPDELFPAESNVYCEITLGHGKKVRSNTVESLKVELIDGLPYENLINKENRDVYYIREFEHTEWQALYLPYSLAYNEWKDKGEVAELINVGLDTENEPILIWRRITEGEILPNHPYIFKPNAIGETIFYGENKTIIPTDSYDVVNFTDNGTTYSLYGTYQGKTDMASIGAFALSGGDFRPTNDDNKTLKPFRIYLTLNNGSQKAPYRVRNIITEGNNNSGIKDITVSNDSESIYFDLSGRMIEKPSAGIYIQNNKKIIFK